MDEIVKIIKVETGGSEVTVKSLKEEINSLRDALLNTEKGSEEYNNILKQLIDDQVRLTDAMRAGQKEATAAEGSYNALVNKMAALKKVWRETTDEVKRKEIGKEIKSINDDLKKLDSSVGDFRRQVGDYTNSITSAFGSMGGAAKGMIGPINGVKTAFSALSSHPLMAVLTGLAALLINGISNGFKSSEENMNKLRVAFSGFKAIGDAVVNIFQGLAGWVAKVAEGAMNLADKLGLITPKMKERQELAKKQIELEQKERKTLEEKAKLEKDSAELRAKADDKETYTAKQRIEFLKEAQAKDEERLGIEKDILEAKLAQAEAEGELTGNSSEENQKIAELRAQVIEADAKIQQSRANANRQLSRMYKEDLSNRTKAITETLNLEKELLQQEYNLAAEGSEEQLRLAKELRTKEFEILKAGLKEKYKSRQEYQKAVKLAEKAYANDMERFDSDFTRKSEDEEYERAKMRLTAYRKGSSQYWKVALETEKTHLKNLQAQLEQATDDKTKEDREKDIIASKESIKNIEDAIIDATANEVNAVNQLILEGTRPMSAYYRKQYTQLMYEYDNMSNFRYKYKKNSESDEDYELRLTAKRKEAVDALIKSYKALADESSFSNETLKKIVFFDENNIYSYGRIDELKDNLESEVVAFKQAYNGIGQYIIENYDTIYEALASKGPSSYLAILNEKTNKSLEEIFSVDSIIDIINNKGFNSEEFRALFQDLVTSGVIPEELSEELLNRLQGLVNGQKAILDESLDNWINLANGIGKVMGSISDIYDENLKAQVKNGKLSQEQAEREFENTIKPMRIAEATINTITGAVAAFMGWQDKGQPFGSIMGAIQAASVTAAGIAQIKQIEATKFGGGGSSSVNTSALAQVTPVMPDFAPEMTGTLTGQQETEELANAIAKTPIHCYITESEVTSAQELARIRNSESTW